MDKVELISCFRPGDLVRAAVLSLGDSRSYLLTTARNELGVVYAKSATSGGARVAVVFCTPCSFAHQWCSQ